MSEDIRVNITRAGVDNPIVTNIPVQLDKLGAHEIVTFQGADPHFTYRAITVMLPLNNSQLILYRDHMIDQVVVDAVTGSLRKYLIISDPQMHIFAGHWEWICTRQRGK